MCSHNVMLTHFIMIYILPTSTTISLHEAQSLQMRLISSFYEEITFYLIVILTVVSYILARALYNYTSEKISDKLTELPTLEFIWTTLPAFILAAIAIPSFLLFYQLDLSMVFQVTDTCIPGKMDRSWRDTVRDLMSLMLEPRYGYKLKGKPETHITSDCISFCNDHKHQIIIIGGVSVAIILGFYGFHWYQDYLTSLTSLTCLTEENLHICRRNLNIEFRYFIDAYYPLKEGLYKYDFVEYVIEKRIAEINALPIGPERENAILEILHRGLFDSDFMHGPKVTLFENR